MPLRHKDHILIVAAELALEHEGEFTVEDLVVAAWKRQPDVFGLRGYPLPDSDKIMNKVPVLVQEGLLERTRVSHVLPTKAGRAVAKRLVQEHAAGTARSTRAQCTR